MKLRSPRMTRAKVRELEREAEMEERAAKRVMCAFGLCTVCGADPNAGERHSAACCEAVS
jgi:hypothetical protein